MNEWMRTLLFSMSVQLTVHAVAVAVLTASAVAAIAAGGVRRFAHRTATVALVAAAIVIAAYAVDGVRAVLAYEAWIAALAVLHGGSLGALVAARARTGIVWAVSAATFVVAAPVSFVIRYLSYCSIAGCA